MRASQSSSAAYSPRPYAAGLAGALLVAAGVAGAAQTHTVLIENMHFTPANLTVRRGDRIVWINKDFFAHTVSDSMQRFDSGNIPASASWSYRANRRGEYAYECRLHPGMQGRLTVQP